MLSMYSDLKYCTMIDNAKIIQSKTKRIYDGLTVYENWDWIVRLEFYADDSDQSFPCSGTVIHRNFVITSADCCNEKDFVKMNFKEFEFITLSPHKRRIKSVLIRF